MSQNRRNTGKRITKPVRIDKELHTALKVEASSQEVTISRLADEILRDRLSPSTEEEIKPIELQSSLFGLYTPKEEKKGQKAQNLNSDGNSSNLIQA